MKKMITMLFLLTFLPVSTQAFNQVDTRITITDLGLLPGGTSSVANAINDNGEVVGGADVANGDIHAFLWTARNGMQDIGGLPGTNYASATDINLRGQVVGSSGLVDWTTGE